MSSEIQRSDVETLIRLAISEDVGGGDITSQAIFDAGDRSKAIIISKQDGVLCGGDMVRLVYELIDPAIEIQQSVQDGQMIHKKNTVMTVSGPTVGILSGERIALNFLQRMTGIATKTSKVVSLLAGTNIRLLDTRKTIPGFRKLDKYAVKTGGGTNHRMGLYDMVMIKDNHIRAAGNITAAVKLVRDRYGSKYTIEVEAATLDEVAEATSSGADIIMLDNMDTTMMKDAIKLINKKALIEISGNIDVQRIAEIRDLNIDFISMGSLTHSVDAFDLSMDFNQ